MSSSATAAAPAVSVVMPVHDGERFLREAVESVLAQTLADVELVAVDDGSTDSTRDILEEYARADSRVVVGATDHVGQADARNAAVALARADLIAFLDADDVAYADRLQRQCEFLAGHEEVALVGGAMTFINEDGCAFAEDVRYPTTDGEIRTAFDQMTPIANSAALVRRSVFVEVGGLRRAFADSEDLDLWLRIAERHRLGNLEQTVVRYRIHGAQASVQRLEQQSLTALAARLSARARSTGGADPFDGVDRVDRDLLLGLGATEHELAENLVLQGRGSQGRSIAPATWTGARSCSRTFWPGRRRPSRPSSRDTSSPSVPAAIRTATRLARSDQIAAAGLVARACSMTSARMRSRSSVGSQPIAPRIFSVDGTRWSMSSMPWPYASSKERTSSATPSPSRR